MKKYKIELTENQLRVVTKAIEEYFRLRMGQDMDFCDDLAFMYTDLSPENPKHDKIFERALSRRDHLRELMVAFFRIAFEPQGYPQRKTDDMLIAEDIWDAVRVATGKSRWENPLHVSEEPLPIIEEVSE